ncbi:thermonuclease family protein [Pirellulaceae bacterium SH449]
MTRSFQSLTLIAGVLLFGLQISSFAWGQSTSSSKAKSSPKEEQTLIGKVKRVIDGDTIIVVDDSGKENEVQLDGIDAPEIKQDFGKDSTKLLEKLVESKKVSVKWTSKDNYDRILGKIYVEETFVNLEMLKKGAAWHYKQYNKDEELAKAEEDAKDKKLGLWKDKSPEAPWEYRKKNRSRD